MGFCPVLFRFGGDARVHRLHAVTADDHAVHELRLLLRPRIEHAGELEIRSVAAVFVDALEILVGDGWDEIVLLQQVDVGVREF